jgi:hypothetical protein
MSCLVSLVSIQSRARRAHGTRMVACVRCFCVIPRRGRRPFRA